MAGEGPADRDDAGRRDARIEFVRDPMSREPDTALAIRTVAGVQRGLILMAGRPHGTSVRNIAR